MTKKDRELLEKVSSQLDVINTNLDILDGNMDLSRIPRKYLVFDSGGMVLAKFLAYEKIEKSMNIYVDTKKNNLLSVIDVVYVPDKEVFLVFTNPYKYNVGGDKFNSVVERIMTVAKQTPRLLDDFDI